MIAIPLFSGLLAAALGATAPATPLSVSMTCSSGLCEAWADGGTGVYTFTWTGASENGERGAFSSADYTCPRSLLPGQYLYVSVQVTDSSGASVSPGDYAVDCGEGELQPDWR